MGGTSANLVDASGAPQEVEVSEVTAGLFDVMEFVPLLGRVLVPADDAPGAPRVAVLGHHFWTTRYQGEPGIIGATIRLDGEPKVVVGVLPTNVGLTAVEDVWRPAGHTSRSERAYGALGIVAETVSAEALRRRLDDATSRLAEAREEEWLGRGVIALDFHGAYYGSVSNLRDRLLRSAGALLFVMALANVANLFLVYARARARELAVRRALGAGRLTILRQLAIEATIPAVLGSAGAALVAGWALAWYQGASDAYGVGFVWQVYRLEAPHLALILGGALTSTLFVSLAASARELRDDGGSSLRGGRGSVGSRFRLWARDSSRWRSP